MTATTAFLALAGAACAAYVLMAFADRQRTARARERRLLSIGR